MDDPQTILIGIVGIGFLLLYAWSTFRYQQTTNRHAEQARQTELQQKRHDEQQSVADEQFKLVGELQKREIVLYDRAESPMLRVEAIVSQIESRLK
jgi:arginine exporter protein ArgO